MPSSSILDLKKQIENYDSLKIYKSYRGISTLIILFSLLTDSFYLLGGSFYIFDLIFILVIYSVLMIFIYKGKKWAIILAMVYYTIDRVMRVNETESGASFIMINWMIYMYFFYHSLIIEIARDKIKKTIN